MKTDLQKIRERIKKLQALEKKVKQEQEQKFINEIANTVLNFFANDSEKDCTVLEQQINSIKQKFNR
jgi:hypothetical protein